MPLKLVEGKVYFTNRPGKYIFTQGEYGKYLNYICINESPINSSYSGRPDYFDFTDKSTRKATVNEIKWLNECIKFNKFIPLSEISFKKSNYKYLIKLFKKYNIK